MPQTERLYYSDSHLIEFEALVTDKTDRVSGWTAVTLDRTAFYPTGGGQPSDTGTLNDARVLECIDAENEGVLHVIQGHAPEIGTRVKGRVDWPRRLDHIQQHTGQHILSQAFVTLFDAPTKSFRVLGNSCEIDLELTNPTNEVIERAVELANNVIWEDRQITITSATADEAAQLPLRKEPARAGELRLIEIEGFDTDRDLFEQAKPVVELFVFFEHSSGEFRRIIASSAKQPGNSSRGLVCAAVIGEGAHAGDPLNSRQTFSAFPTPHRNHPYFARAVRMRAAARRQIKAFDFN